ncbi:MAG: hypothetical protein ACYCR5_11315, partial [Leptospirillum sp.]
AGWNAFMALQPGICRMIWDGDASLSTPPHPWVSRRGLSVPSSFQLDIILFLEYSPFSGTPGYPLHPGHFPPPHASKQIRITPLA